MQKYENYCKYAWSYRKKFFIIPKKIAKQPICLANFSMKEYNNLIFKSIYTYHTILSPKVPFLALPPTADPFYATDLFSSL